jgi:hypothetical protein
MDVKNTLDTSIVRQTQSLNLLARSLKVRLSSGTLNTFKDVETLILRKPLNKTLNFNGHIS